MNAPTEVALLNNSGFSLVPKDLGQALELSRMIAESDLAPNGYKGKPGNVLIAVQMGQEVGLSPMSAIQNIAVINGKPGLYGDAGKALLLAQGFHIEEDDVSVIQKTGMGRCKITRPGHPPCERTFSVENAKTAGLWKKTGPWSTYPERQMAWRAFWFAARDIASDVLKGLRGLEEVRDYQERDVTPQNSEVTTTWAPAKPAIYDQAAFDNNFPSWERLIKSGKKSADEIIAIVSSKGELTAEQKAKINAVKIEKMEVAAAHVAEKLNAAKDLDMLNAEADLIREVVNEGERSGLFELYNKRKAELIGEQE